MIGQKLERSQYKDSEDQTHTQASIVLNIWLEEKAMQVFSNAWYVSE